MRNESARPCAQPAESLLAGILLALSGGYMDAYTYLYRGHVFANAQTGNIILLGIRLSEGDWQAALAYLFPILSFAAGVLIAALLEAHFPSRPHLRWQQLALLAEAALLLAVGFISRYADLLSNCLVSLACGIQVQAFRRIHGNPMATTMCIGNLRAGTALFCAYFQRREAALLRKGLLYYGIIAIFACGAVLGNVGVALLAGPAIWISAGVLLALCCMMAPAQKAP